MIEFYPQIRFVHIACVLLSGALFFVRSIGVLRYARWPMSLPVRFASYTIDTVLLTAALMLLTILPGAIFANGWLTTKLVLLMMYVLLGSFALRRARHQRTRAACFAGACLVFLLMLSIARLHQPFGALNMVFR